MKNYAGRNDVDNELREELTLAGIEVYEVPELMRGKVSSEIGTIITGSLHGWSFQRAWYYWVAKGPGIEVEAAEKLHAKFGKEVRVAGHCMCPSPREWYKGLAVGYYHVDTQEGLRALANTIKDIVEREKKK